jgi:PAS domain S-box-containing protein
MRVLFFIIIAGVITYLSIIRIRAEEALKESEEKFRGIFDMVNDGIHIHEIGPDGMPGKFIEINEVACQMLQYTHEELLGHGPLDFVTAYHNRPLNEVIGELSTAGHSIFETEHRRKDGVVIPVEVNAHVVSLHGKRVIASVVRNITERKQAEEALRESERRLGEIIDFLPDPTFAIDTSGHVIAWNRAMEDLTGRSKADMLGKGDYEYSLLIYGEKRPVLIDLIQHEDPNLEKKYDLFIRSGDRVIAEASAPHLNRGKGEYLWMIASLLYDHTGTIAGSIESIRILTDRKREEEAFKIANKKITMLNSITRHDILNQLLVLRAYIELSKQKNQDPVIAEFISKEEKAAESIQMQIEFTRTYQDIGSQAPRWQNLEEIVASAIGKLKPVITDMNFALGNAEIFADPLLEKVFYNLMENSLRHGDHVTRMDFSTQERENGLVILYSDNGGGISADDKKMLFKKGFGKHTGLGLFLSREILSITGITIKETGEPGKGARFEMTVPAGMWRRYGTGTGED